MADCLQASANNSATHKGAVQITASLRELITPPDTTDHTKEAKEIIEALKNKMQKFSEGGESF